MAASRLLGGAKSLLLMAAALEALPQLSLVIIGLPLASRRSRKGSGRALGTLNGGWPSVGPRPRIITLSLSGTVTPAIITLAPVWTKPRVETPPNVLTAVLSKS